MHVGWLHQRCHEPEGNADVALGTNSMTDQRDSVAAVADEPEEMRQDGFWHGLS